MPSNILINLLWFFYETFRVMFCVSCPGLGVDYEGNWWRFLGPDGPWEQKWHLLTSAPERRCLLLMCPQEVPEFPRASQPGPLRDLGLTKEKRSCSWPLDHLALTRPPTHCGCGFSSYITKTPTSAQTPLKYPRLSPPALSALRWINVWVGMTSLCAVTGPPHPAAPWLWPLTQLWKVTHESHELSEVWVCRGCWESALAGPEQCAKGREQVPKRPPLWPGLGSSTDLLRLCFRGQVKLV